MLLLLLLAGLVCQQAPATAQPADETAAAQSIVLDDFERAEPSPWWYSGPGELTIVAGVAPGSEGRSVMRLETTVALRDNRIWFRGSQPCLQAHQPDRDHQPALREPDGGHGLRERLTGALLDRLTHRVHILEANGESYRLREARNRLKKQASSATTLASTQGGLTAAVWRAIHAAGASLLGRHPPRLSTGVRRSTAYPVRERGLEP